MSEITITGRKRLALLSGRAHQGLALEIAELLGTGLLVGYLWSFSTTGLLASFGIGGLALAFASKETLENVFGAGILMGDRPFKKGDRIVSEGVNRVITLFHFTNLVDGINTISSGNI